MPIDLDALFVGTLDRLPVTHADLVDKMLNSGGEDNVDEAVLKYVGFASHTRWSVPRTKTTRERLSRPPRMDVVTDALLAAAPFGHASVFKMIRDQDWDGVRAVLTLDPMLAVWSAITVSLSHPAIPPRDLVVNLLVGRGHWAMASEVWSAYVTHTDAGAREAEQPLLACIMVPDSLSNPDVDEVSADTMPRAEADLSAAIRACDAADLTTIERMKECEAVVNELKQQAKASKECWQRDFVEWLDANPTCGLFTIPNLLPLSQMCTRTEPETVVELLKRTIMYHPDNKGVVIGAYRELANIYARRYKTNPESDCILRFLWSYHDGKDRAWVNMPRDYVRATSMEDVD